MTNIVTPHGIINAETKQTYHMAWDTYAWDYQNGTVGLKGIVDATYGCDMNMVSSNDMYYSVDVEVKAEVDHDDEDIERFVTEQEFYAHDLDIIIQDLVNREILPTGSYIVRVTW